MVHSFICIIKHDSSAEFIEPYLPPLVSASMVHEVYAATEHDTQKETITDNRSHHQKQMLPTSRFASGCQT
jgi:hypothetical protein